MANTWVNRAPMPKPRAFLAAGVVNGTLYAVGGGDAAALATVEAYDWCTNSWSNRNYAGARCTFPFFWRGCGRVIPPMPTPRSHLAVGVVNGVLYAVGGISGGNVLGVVEAYEPCSNTWTLRAAMPTPRTGLAIGVVNGLLYAVGGADGASNVLPTVEVYQPGTNTWVVRAPMPTPSCNLAADAVNGTLYALGGQFALTEMAIVQAFNPATNAWSNRAPMPTARENLVAGAVDGILYAIGGWNSAQIGQSELHTIEAYDPATNSWSTRAPMPTARRNLAAGVVNGAIVCAGGYAGSNSLAVTEAYRP